MSIAAFPNHNNNATVRHNWTIEEVNQLFAMPFNDLLFQAQTIHRQHFDPNHVQVSTLLSIKTAPAQKTASTVRNLLDMTLVLKKNV